MHHGFKGRSLARSGTKKSLNEGPVGDVTGHKFRLRRHQFAVAMAKIIHNHWPMAPFEEQFRNRAPNVTCSTGD